MRLYLDSAPIIYLVEGTPELAEAVEKRIGADELQLVTCELVYLECLVKPLREKNAALVEDFEDFFANLLDEMTPVTRAILQAAAPIRATHTFLRTPDAIHLAAAIETGCERTIKR